MEFYLDNYYVVKEEPGMYVLHQTARAQRCPSCGSDKLKLHSNYYRKVYDYNQERNESTVLLKIRVRRFQCEKCKKTFKEDTQGIVPYARITERFRKVLMNHRMERHASFMSMSQIYKIPLAVVYNVCADVRGK